MIRFFIILIILLVVLRLGWPWIASSAQQLHLGHLPGDITMNVSGVIFYFPITTCILISLAIACLLWLIGR
ncbi:MAG: DUF2905 domain-containing protein [Gammaproteobacteria bacterium]